MGRNIAGAKAAAKCHLRLDRHSFLPRFALIDTARDNDAKRAREICAGIRPGEFGLFDKAYVDCSRLWALVERGIFRHPRQGQPRLRLDRKAPSMRRFPIGCLIRGSLCFQFDLSTVSIDNHIVPRQPGLNRHVPYFGEERPEPRWFARGPANGTRPWRKYTDP
jgi:hypothetical protein